MKEPSVTPCPNSHPGNRRWTPAPLKAVLLCWVLLACGGCGTTGSTEQPTIVVNSLADVAKPPAGTVTLRSAMSDIPSGGKIVFDPSLDNGTILLSIVGSDNSALKGEIYVGMTFQGYGERNYGRSALYAAKDLTIDASALPNGITLTWTGGNPARVLAVYGNLTMRNVNISSGFSRAEPIAGGTQRYTLARGGGLAVWGTATLDRCIVSGNRAEGPGDNTAGRDQATYGGGIFANGVVMSNCIVSGNSAIDSGAAGGGIYSVGGADGPGIDSSLTGCTVSGNRVTARNAYGGGIFTLGGGPNYLKALRLTNCTIAGNLVEDFAGIVVSQYYYRGGGVYMGGGYLSVTGCTIAENGVTGPLATFNRKPNMGGGGIAATVGNAHVVEDITIRHSIVAGNTLNGAAEDLFTGSVLHFYSHGYNLLGKIDFSQILVPIPLWTSMSRKHWPKTGDLDNVAASDVLDLPNVARHVSIRSVGTDNGQLAVLWYPPKGSALDKIPAGGYTVDNVVLAEYDTAGAKDDFLPFVLDNMLSTGYCGGILGPGFGAAYRTTFEAAKGMSLDNVAWYMDPARWPADSRNIPWIDFWRGLDNAIGGSLGTVQLGDDFWGSRGTGTIRLTDNVVMSVTSTTLGPFWPSGSDQLGTPRPNGAASDIGAIERIP
jgi:hypothetical protein